MIKDLKEEGKVSLFCLIHKAEMGRTNKNTPYLSLTLEDASGMLDAKFWNLTEEQIKQYQAGQVVKATGDLIFYRNAAQLRVRALEIQPEADASIYVRHAPMEKQEMKEKVDALVSDMQNPVLSQITATLLKNHEQAFYTYPAAVRNHHYYAGGLAYHSLSMASLALQVLKNYPWLDYDLLIAGVLLHDMGKIEELSSAVLPEYTPAGNLLGHISMMAAQIDRVAVEMGMENSEEVMLLKHMILSHHGKHEYGSPVLPMIPEAEVLTLLDNLDARMFMMDEALESTTPGTFGPRIFALDNRMLYRKTWDDQNNHPQQNTEQKQDGGER